ncbi:hypothetical protein EJ03DRAFT_178287 [Teratosphaeria nubilosa]|uniref:Uncharacterized protein n=1 Tax=Teratosphaeria nubilosa TaxID=161662 RepID=A0A6G1L2L7_9PEZI|nr:hypothetical protein EJ03DRAFT_178287 [Teratosphaeria nubilosa]
MSQPAQTSISAPTSRSDAMPFAFHNTSSNRSWNLGCSCGRATCVLQAPPVSPSLRRSTRAVLARGGSATLPSRTQPSRGDLRRLARRQQMRSTGALSIPFAPPPVSEVRVYTNRPLPPTPASVASVQEIEAGTEGVGVPATMVRVARVVQARVVSIGPVPPRLRRTQRRADVGRAVAAAQSVVHAELYAGRSLPSTPSSVYPAQEIVTSPRRSPMTPGLSSIQETPIEMYGPRSTDDSVQLTPDGMYGGMSQDCSTLAPSSTMGESLAPTNGNAARPERPNRAGGMRERASTLRRWLCC